MTKPLTDSIPTDRAWKVARRIYVRCGYRSQLNEQLRAIGAKWDADERALWVGSGKADKVIPLIEAAEQRQAAVVAVKAAASTSNRWVHIPFEATGIRERAKALDGIFDKPTRRWAMPTPEAHAEIQSLLTAHAAQAAQERAARKQADAAARAADAERAKEDATARAARVLAESGRTPTGEVGQFGEHSTARMNRATAERQARPLGSVVKVGGKRAVITGVKVWFTNDDLASSVCWHADTHDEAHWDWRYDVVYVEPTAAEVAADEAEAARRADEAEMVAVFRELERAPRTEAGEREAWSAVSGPTIRRRGGSPMGGFDDGRIILDGDRAVWQHPGWYDDYRRSERASTDPDVVARVRALTDCGPRTVGAYTVTEG